MRIIALTLCVLFIEVHAQVTEELNSKRLLALQQQLQGGVPNALENFWAQVSIEKTPLVEPFPQESGKVLVTFLFRATQNIENAVVLTELNDNDLMKNKMSHLVGTDIWYKTYKLPSDARFTYQIGVNDPLTPLAEETDWMKRSAHWQLDPLNPKIVDMGFYKLCVVELPQAPTFQRNKESQANTPGKIIPQKIHSSILNADRTINVYIPSSYSEKNKPLDLLVLFDGKDYLNSVSFNKTLDNLIANKEIPPTIAVFVDNPFATRSTELACDLQFAKFISTELIDWVSKHYTISNDPKHHIIAGSSFGGLGSAYAGLMFPQVFGNVISLSASFWWAPDSTEYGWLMRKFIARKLSAQKFYLAVGRFETAPKSDDSPSQLFINRHMRDVLQAKGYEVLYSEYNGAHEYINWQYKLAEALAFMLKK